MYRPLFIGIVFLWCVFLAARGASAQEAPAQEAPARDSEKTSGWYKSLFIEAGGLADIPPKMLLGAVKPMFGFRGALGYEWRNARFSLSSGYSKASGADKLVESLSFTPLTGRLGYALPIKDGWGAQADLGFGVQLSKIFHYETALDLLADRRKESFEIKPLVEGNLYATYTLPRDFLKFYAGGGADIMFETEGPVPLPVIEAGISIKPLALYSPRYSPRKRKAAPPVPKPGPEKPTRHEFLIYFEADRGTRILAQSWPLLREAGRLLQENPRARITLRGYAAPTGTTVSQVVISAARVWFCAEYLEWECNIPEDRIIMQFFGSEETNLLDETDWDRRRHVDLIIEYSSTEQEDEVPAVKVEPYKPVTTNQNLYKYLISFEENRGTKVLAESLSQLREAGRLLRRNPRSRITLRGYAPSGDSENQIVLSAARMWHCVEYFKWEHRITNSRIHLEFFDPAEKPVTQDAERKLRNSVELIVELRGRR